MSRDLPHWRSGDDTTMYGVCSKRSPPTVRGCRTPTPSRLSAEARQKGVAVPFGETGICTTTGSPRSGGRQGKSTGVCPPKMRTNGLRLAVAAARAVAESAIPTRNPATKRRIRVPTFLFRPYDE
jgi:hypothetical protein